jgi:hypothetical protein
VLLVVRLITSLVTWMVMAATIAWKLVLFMLLAQESTMFKWLMFKAILVPYGENCM